MFGAEKKDISIIEFNHSNNKFVTTMFFESGFIVLVNRLGKIISSKESCDHENILGTVTGWLSLIMTGALVAAIVWLHVLMTDEGLTGVLRRFPRKRLTRISIIWEID